MNIVGFFIISIIMAVEIRRGGVMSFVVIRGWKFILSMFVFIEKGFEDPFSCSSIKWTIIIIIMIIGRRKCREKKRFRVGWDTDSPPQIHVTISFPIIGIAEMVPVITVAPQNDICPHGRT